MSEPVYTKTVKVIFIKIQLESAPEGFDSPLKLVPVQGGD